MRQLASAELKMHRVKAIRWSVYQLAGKVVNSVRQLLLKVSEKRMAFFERLLKLFTEYRPPTPTDIDMILEVMHSKSKTLYIQ